MEFMEYNDAVKEDRGELISGRLKLTRSQVIFKNDKTGKVDNLNNNDFKSIIWQRMATGYCIRIMLNNGQLYRYGGFKEREKDAIEKFIQSSYSCPFAVQEFSTKGWNWGTATFEGSALNFDLAAKKQDKNEKAFEIPLSNVSHCTTTKNEVTVEFHQNDDAPVSLMEMRFHIPCVDNTNAVSMFMEQVLSNANIIRETGECIVIIKELQSLTPRGRYDIKLFPTFIQLHGKTFDYKIPITSVLRLFQLPHKDSRQIFFVLSLDPPIKQGQTRYHFLILLFNKEEQISVNLGLTDEEIKQKYDGKLTKTMQGPLYEVIAKIMRTIIQRKITLPDSSFSKDTPVISCSYRASNGLMYPLERGFIYLHKPPLHIRFDEIASINFARSGGSTRSFDFEIETKSAIVHTFSSIDKEEYSKLYDFVTAKNLRVKNRGTESNDTKTNDDLIDSDMDDDEPDAYLQRVREEGRIREEAGDSDESDESFNPGQSDDEVAEEFDSNVSSSSEENSDENESGHEKRKKKEKSSKQKKKHKGEKKKSSKKKDSDKPKRPQSAFFLWMNDNREQIKKKYPELSLTEISKKAGDLWKEISKSEKAKYEEMANKAKKQYEKQMAEYKESGGGTNSQRSEKPSKKSESKSSKSPVKSSQQYKSKEYISSGSSSDESSDSDKKKSKKTKESKDKRSSSESEVSEGSSSGSISD